MTLRACAARARTRLAGEGGFGVIEVLVSALIVVLISLSTLAAIDAAGRTQDTNKSRSVASSLAQDDVERLRAMKITELAALGANSDPRTVMVDGEKYFVQSKGEYLAGQAGSDNCASDDEAPKYLKLTSTVTWPTMRAAKPVVANTLRATPSGTIGDFGSLAVDINGRAGAGQEGIVVKIVPDATAAANGGVTTEATTNSKGCVLFGYIATGRYTISFAKPGWVLAPYPNDPTEEDTAVVAADSIASKAYQYDQAAAASVRYVRNASYGSATWGGTNTTTGNGFTIQNASLGSPDFKTFANNPATSLTATSTSGLVNFPYTGGWEAWSGVCMGNKPPALADRGSVTLTPGSTVSTDVREFRLRVQVQRRTTSAGGQLRDRPERQHGREVHAHHQRLHQRRDRHLDQQQRRQQHLAHGELLDLRGDRALGQLHGVRPVRQRRQQSRQADGDGRGHHDRRGHAVDQRRHQDHHPVQPDLGLLMLTRARSESGFTLIELLVAISLGMVVIIALLTLIDTSGSARARLTDKTETVQRMRIGMDRIVRVLRTQVCASTTAPPIISGDASAVTFYSDTSTTGSNGAFRPRKVALYYSSAVGGSVVQDTYVPTNTSSPWTYDASPSTRRTLIDNIAGAAGGSSIFKYYAFNDLENPITNLPLDTTLSSSTVAANSVAKVTKIDVGLTARPQSGNTGAGRSTTLTNTVLTRNSDFSGGDNIGRSWGPRCG